jgi:hypothetical protein
VRRDVFLNQFHAELMCRRRVDQVEDDLLFALASLFPEFVLGSDDIAGPSSMVPNTRAARAWIPV